MNLAIGNRMHGWAKDLFPICRSITGQGVRETLRYLNGLMPELIIHEVPSGTKAFDWVVPDEWNIQDGWIEDQLGERVVEFRSNNLHVVGYSAPVDTYLPLRELEDHLHSLPELPEAIPYVTSYYQRAWGFCLRHSQRKALREGVYRARIDSTLKPGVLNYGELVIRGNSSQEVFLSTYICHPSLANNELSGPVVATGLAQWLSEVPNLRYTYRLVFIPETIGSLVYLSRHLDHLRKHVIAGFNITCIGDDRSYSFLPSRSGSTLADRAACHALRNTCPTFITYSWLDRGSDERQYCAPNIDLPVASIMRSKYGEYPEYHTSLDNLDLISPKGLEGGFRVIQKAIQSIELNCFPNATVLGEPQLGKRGLYPTLSKKEKSDSARAVLNLLTYADGTRDLIEIADIVGISAWELADVAKVLAEKGLLRLIQ